MGYFSFREWVYWTLQVFLTPTCWLQNYPFSKNWDYELNALLMMEEPKEKEFSRYSLLLGTREVWVANHPYASFYPCDVTTTIRPSRKTILRAGRMYKQYVFVTDHLKYVQ